MSTHNTHKSTPVEREPGARAVRVLMHLLHGVDTHKGLQEAEGCHRHTIRRSLDAIEAAGIDLHRGRLYVRVQPSSLDALRAAVE